MTQPAPLPSPSNRHSVVNHSRHCLTVRARRWILGAGLVLVILLTLLANLALLPGWLAHVHAFPGGDKLGHFLIYGGLMAALDAAAKNDATTRLLSRRALCLMLCVAAEECAQGWLPTRTASGWDLACSCAGILAARQWCRRDAGPPPAPGDQGPAASSLSSTSSMRSRDTGLSSIAATPGGMPSARCRRSL